MAPPPFCLTILISLGLASIIFPFTFFEIPLAALQANFERVSCNELTPFPDSEVFVTCSSILESFELIFNDSNNSTALSSKGVEKIFTILKDELETAMINGGFKDKNSFKKNRLLI